MDLSIIIINWHSRDYVQKCLKSLFEDKPAGEFEVIVIDNATYDGCEHMLMEGFADVFYIQSDRNLGFGRANNLAAERANGDVVLFLNPDTELRPGAIKRLLSVLYEKKDAGIVSGLLLNSDGSIQTSCLQAFPSILNQVLDFEFLRQWFPRWKMWGMQPLFENLTEPVAVDVVTGAVMMMRYDVFQKVGRFSTDYFMYGEDLDLCHKVMQSGRKVYFSPDAEIVHHDGGATKNKQASDFATVMMRESIYRFFKRNPGGAYAEQYRAAMRWTAHIRLGLFFVMANLGMRTRLAAPRQKWRKVPSWARGGETWAAEMADSQ